MSEYPLVVKATIVNTMRSRTLSFVIDFAEIPNEVGDWVGQEFFFDDNILAVLKADKTMFRRYVNSSGDEIWLFIQGQSKLCNDKQWSKESRYALLVSDT